MAHFRGLGAGTTSRDKIKDRIGQDCERVRAVTSDDEAWDVKVAKTIVRFADGTEAAVINDEIGD